MIFADRQEAGRKLATALQKHSSRGDVVVYALPRGGVVCAAEVAKALHAPMDLIIVRKIGHPESPEYAIGAVAEDGEPLLSEQAKRINGEWLPQAIKRQREEIQRRRTAYLGERSPISSVGKTCIIIDDGIATGFTLMTAAEYACHKLRPKKIILAVPVAPTDIIKQMRGLADDVVVLYEERNHFGAIGMYYDSFPQVGDEEVIRLMKEVNA